MHVTIEVDGGEKTLSLLDVLVVPGFTPSLFSVRQASARGYEIEFHKNRVLVKHKGTVELQGTLHGKLYVLPTVDETGAAKTAPVPPTAEMWHLRFAHLGATLLERTSGAVDGMHLNKAQVAALRQADCPPCIGGQMVRAPFHAREITTTEPLQLIHTDAAGPMEIRSSGGSVFMVSVIEDFSGFKALVPVQTKREADDVVMTVVNRWEVQTGKRVQVARTDGWKEYTGKDWPRWLAEKGVQHQTTTRYTPQSNGVVERYNRVVVEPVMAALLDSGLDRKYWAEAAVTVNCLGNRVIGRTQSATPYELFHGVRPNVAHQWPLDAAPGYTCRACCAASYRRPRSRAFSSGMGSTRRATVSSWTVRWRRAVTFALQSRPTPSCPPRARARRCPECRRTLTTSIFLTSSMPSADTPLTPPKRPWELHPRTPDGRLDGAGSRRIH